MNPLFLCGISQSGCNEHVPDFQIFKVTFLFLYNKELDAVVMPFFGLSAFSEYQLNCSVTEGKNLFSLQYYPQNTDLNDRSMLCESSKVITSNIFQRAPDRKNLNVQKVL